MIHKTAVIDSEARVEPDVEIGPFCYIGPGVSIAGGSRLGPNVTVVRDTIVGRNCAIHSGAVVGDDPQDKSFDRDESFCTIGDNCVLREGVTVHRGTKAGTRTVIGPDCYLMAFSHVAHNCELGQGVVMANGALLGGYVSVGDGVFISGNTGVHQFVRIGRLAMVGGQSGLSKDLPPFCTLASVSLNRVAGLNVVGMRRAGLGPDERVEIKKAFDLLYRSGLNYQQAPGAIRDRFHGSAAIELADFVEKSERGICALKSNG